MGAAAVPVAVGMAGLELAVWARAFDLESENTEGRLGGGEADSSEFGEVNPEVTESGLAGRLVRRLILRLMCRLGP